MQTIRYKDFVLQVTVRSNARKMILKHKPGEEFFHLTVPNRTSRTEMLRFLDANESWLRSQMQQTDHLWQPSLQKGERGWLLGQLVTLGEGAIPTGSRFLQLRNQKLHDEIVRILPYWQHLMHAQSNVIRWREMTSRWGSCNVKTGVITLNTKLGAMSPELIAYVLVHELNHLHHPDHSAAFHQDMTRYMPDWKMRKKQLNDFGPLILPPLEDVT